MGALAMTWKPAYREPFEPLPGDVTFVPYGDVDALAAAVDDDTAAFVARADPGRGGRDRAAGRLSRAAREITAAHGALLWLDEVQTGIGRTGAWFAHSAAGVVPDLVTLAKGLGSGFPIGACIGLGASGSPARARHHGTTFGGNPVAAVAGLATLAVIERDGLLEHAVAVGAAPRSAVSRRWGIRWSTVSAGVGCSAGSCCATPSRPQSPPPRSTLASSSTRPPRRRSGSRHRSS